MEGGFGNWIRGSYLEAISHGYMASSEIDEETRDEKRVDFAVFLVIESEKLYFTRFLEHDGMYTPVL